VKTRPARIPDVAEPVLSLLLDGRALGGAGGFRGLGTYVRELVAGLARVDSLDVTVTAGPGSALPANVSRLDLPQRGPDRWATAEHHARLALALTRNRASVFHSPAQDPPGRVGRPWVQTVADLLPLLSEEPTYLAERRRWRRWAGRVRSADAVVTFSQHGADQVCSLLDVEPTRIHVIPLAAGTRFRPRSDGPDPILPADRPRPYPYVLNVAEYAPHKGYRQLAQLAGALESAGLPHRVVIAGRLAPQWNSAREQDLSVAGPGARARIELADWVPDLSGLYQGADALVSTSRHEGFGLPLVEAMACGCAVVAFANSAVSEVVGNGGVLVADGDAAAMAEAVIALIGDDSATRSARQSARCRSSAFSWEATVAAHVELYRSVRAATG
jgi:glycosyltransferase involved in cell wall biosynthesis